MRVLFSLFALFLTVGAAHAHSWYGEMRDPQYGACCSGRDCGVWAIQPGQIAPEGEGFRVKLTREQVLQANPESTITHIDQYFPLSRIIPSKDGNWHVCPKFYGEPHSGLRCLMAPPNS